MEIQESENHGGVENKVIIESLKDVKNMENPEHAENL